jgi:uncharacterized protein YuzE
VSFQQYATYDQPGDAIYVYLREGKVVRTCSLSDYRNVDLDAEGRVLGVEFIDVSAGVDLQDVPERDRVEELIQGFGLPVFVG